MSIKSVVLLGLLAFGAYSLQRATPPAPPGATAEDSAAVAKAGVGARFHYGIGHLGSKIMGGSVRRMVHGTEQTLQDMRPGIKKAVGGDGLRARKFSAKIVVMDSTALTDLRLGHPVRAFRGAMEAQSLLASVRDNIRL